MDSNLMQDQFSSILRAYLVRNDISLSGIRIEKGPHGASVTGILGLDPCQDFRR